MSVVERAIVRTLPWVGGGLALSLPLLLVNPSPRPLALSTMHLVGVVALGVGCAFAIAPLAGDDWFVTSRVGPMGRLLFSGAAIVVLSTGMVGLVTLASGAAIGYDPSLQFLQLLSALDIAWVAAAVVVGARRGFGPGIALFLAISVVAFCTWSIWRYLDAVGFGDGGAWIVDGDQLMTLVIPYDMAAAVFAVAVFYLGTRRGHRTAHPSAQS